MKKQEFTIWIPTTFGIGCYKIMAYSITDAFLRISLKDKMKDGWIDDEDGMSHTFSSILGIEETI